MNTIKKINTKQRLQKLFIDVKRDNIINIKLKKELSELKVDEDFYEAFTELYYSINEKDELGKRIFAFFLQNIDESISERILIDIFSDKRVTDDERSIFTGVGDQQRGIFRENFTIAPNEEITKENFLNILKLVSVPDFIRDAYIILKNLSYSQKKKIIEYALKSKSYNTDELIILMISDQKNIFNEVLNSLSIKGTPRSINFLKVIKKFKPEYKNEINTLINGIKLKQEDLDTAIKIINVKITEIDLLGNMLIYFISKDRKNFYNFGFLLNINAGILDCWINTGTSLDEIEFFSGANSSGAEVSIPIDINTGIRLLNDTLYSHTEIKKLAHPIFFIINSLLGNIFEPEEYMMNSKVIEHLNIVENELSAFYIYLARNPIFNSWLLNYDELVIFDYLSKAIESEKNPSDIEIPDSLVNEIISEHYESRREVIKRNIEFLFPLFLSSEFNKENEIANEYNTTKSDILYTLYSMVSSDIPLREIVFFRVLAEDSIRHYLISETDD